MCELFTNLRFVGYRGFSLVFYDVVGREEYICRWDNKRSYTLTPGFLYGVSHEQHLKSGDINYITDVYLPE